MGLFGKLKQEAKETGTCCGGDCNADTMAEAEKVKKASSGVKILGSGCAKCNELEKAAQEALAGSNPIGSALYFNSGYGY